MADEAQLKILKENGVKAWNDWRDKNRKVLPNLGGADFSGANLSGADLSNANLIAVVFARTNLSKAHLSFSSLNGADFFSANLTTSHFVGARLHDSDLRRTDLSGADLTGAEFTWVRLAGANLKGANLSQAYVYMTDLHGANFGRAIIGGTTFANVDLSVVKGIETVVHRAFSEISISTIYGSQGNIPEIFLRGAGVPEPFIVQMKSLVAAMSPIEFYSCFISYSNKDHEFAERLHSDLQAKNVRCWFAPEDLKIGDKFRTRIEESIRIYDKLMVVLSENSIQSTWVEEEVEAALEKERQQNKLVLFPIRLDDAVMETRQAWAASLRRTRHIGEFSHWKDHDLYKKAFDRLLRDLKAESAKAATPKD